jgi:hypothetical protein
MACRGHPGMGYSVLVGCQQLDTKRVEVYRLYATKRG